MDHPDDAGVGAVGLADLDHAEGRGSDEIRPPAVVAITLDTEVFPFPKCRATGEDDVLGLAQGGQGEKKDEDDARHWLEFEE